jgi:single-stranded-DNA-specific exonuclease
MELAEELQSLAPFGRGNPPVCLMVEQARFLDARAMGEGRHVRFTIEAGEARARGVCFGQGATLPVPEGEPARATFTLEVNEWNGVSEPRLLLRRAEGEGHAALAPEEPGFAPAGAGSPTPVAAGAPKDAARGAAAGAGAGEEQLQLALL